MTFRTFVALCIVVVAIVTALMLEANTPEAEIGTALMCERTTTGEIICTESP